MLHLPPWNKSHVANTGYIPPFKGRGLAFNPWKGGPWVGEVYYEAYYFLFYASLCFCLIAGKVVRAPSGVMHGKSSLVYYDEKGEESLFIGLSKYKLYSFLQYP
jgi:hypothetical protein